MNYLPGVVTLSLDENKCTGCGRCTQVCPRAVFAINNGRAAIADRDACIECGACKKNCAFNAISVRAGVGCAAAILSSKKCGSDDYSDCSC